MSTTDQIIGPLVHIYEPRYMKNYFLPVNLVQEHAWILPANFFIESQDWSLVFDASGICIYLKINADVLVCMHKKMNASGQKQFERDWVAFQSSGNQTFDLRGFDII